MDISIRELNEIKRQVDLAEAAVSPAPALFGSKPQILAEGDSWFAYPRRHLLFGAAGNVISRLKSAHGEFEIDDVSSNGDEAVAMVSGEQKIDLLKRIASKRYDLILFSAGGNDLVGQYDFDFFLRDRRSVSDPLDCLLEERVSRRLGRILSSYSDLIDLVGEFSRNRSVKIIGHTYDWAIPSPEGASFWNGTIKVDKGRSWMHPYMVAKNITDPDEQYHIVKALLSRFSTELRDLAVASGGRFVVVDTQGTLPERDRNFWVNEIHPNPEGFRRIADVIYAQGIKPHLP